ncbi:hypothetical protein K438DRAFT_1755128 [Mycena galopus ATCC 62051]|nr:hypothetical protein K438DRAFT_1755128 [Mycena galopus ATCC 62051]
MQFTAYTTAILCAILSISSIVHGQVDNERRTRVTLTSFKPLPTGGCQPCGGPLTRRTLGLKSVFLCVKSIESSSRSSGRVFRAADRYFANLGRGQEIVRNGPERNRNRIEGLPRRRPISGPDSADGQGDGSLTGTSYTYGLEQNENTDAAGRLTSYTHWAGEQMRVKIFSPDHQEPLRVKPGKQPSTLEIQVLITSKSDDSSSNFCLCLPGCELAIERRKYWASGRVD